MAVRPKTRPADGIMAEPPPEEISCGYVMHQYKSLKPKMRWGQLWTGVNLDGRHRCTIRLFKFDIANPKPGTLTKKDLKLKVCFEFSEDDFCGLEKGEHYTRNGMRRYICVILRDKHLIVQDAITALTDTDHNVIGTWYRKVSDTMHYLNRWRVCADENADVKFLHLSRENLCECYSLHNSHVGQKGKILLDELYKTKDITNLYETRDMFNGEPSTQIVFYDRKRGLDMKIVIFVFGEVRLASILSGMPVNQGLNPTLNGGRVTLCPRFDDLNVNTNLIKVSPAKKPDTSPMNLKQLSGTERVGAVNQYVLYDSEPGASTPTHVNITSLNREQGPPLPARGLFGPETGFLGPGTQALISEEQNRGNVHQTRDGVGQHNRGNMPQTLDGGAQCNGGDTHMKFSPTNPFASTNGVAPRHHSVRGDPLPPTPPRDDFGLGKKAPEFLTQASVDSGFLTGSYLSTMNTTATGTTSESRLRIATNNTRASNTQQDANQLENYDGPYLNILNQSPVHSVAPVNENHESPDLVPTTATRVVTSGPNAPLVPPRVERPELMWDPLRNAIETDTLPPLGAEGETARPGYENSMDGCDIEVTIGEIMKGTHHEVRGRNLGLPYAVYMGLILGLEKDSVADGNWRGLASALGLKLRDVEQIESVVHNHSHLLPAEIVLLHWQRTEAPYPFTRESLKRILSESMGRLDLANLIPLEDRQEEEEGEDEGKEDETQEKKL